MLIYNDVWKAWHATEPFGIKCAALAAKGLGLDVPVGCRTLPVWLAIVYVTANTALSLLNVWWFWKMIAAVRKRFPEEGKDLKRGKDLTNGNGAKDHVE